MFVVSGPSGAGKDTLVEGLKVRRERLLYSRLTVWISRPHLSLSNSACLLLGLWRTLAA